MGYSTGAARSTLALRWAVATATGLLLERPCRVYYARLVGPGAASAVLRDSVDATGPVVLGLATAAAGADDWPRIPVSVNVMKGLHLTLTGTATLLVGWELD